MARKMISKRVPRVLEGWKAEARAEDMADPIYRQGFEHDGDDDNPYPFPETLSVERARIACIEGPLTEAQKKRLGELNEIIDNSEWARWASGWHSRWDIIFICR